QAFSSKSDFAGQGGAWQLRGELEEGGKVEFTLRDDGVACRWQEEAFTFDAAQDFDTQLAPNQSGGLLVALHVWRRMLVRGPKEFGETYYHGAAPLIEREGRFDVLVGTHNVVEARFSFAP